MNVTAARSVFALATFIVSYNHGMVSKSIFTHLPLFTIVLAIIKWQINNTNEIVVSTADI